VTEFHCTQEESIRRRLRIHWTKDDDDDDSNDKLTEGLLHPWNCVKSVACMSRFNFILNMKELRFSKVSDFHDFISSNLQNWDSNSVYLISEAGVLVLLRNCLRQVHLNQFLEMCQSPMVILNKRSVMFDWWMWLEIILVAAEDHKRQAQRKVVMLRKLWSVELHNGRRGKGSHSPLLQSRKNE
jgi:hypothetical protein